MRKFVLIAISLLPGLFFSTASAESYDEITLDQLQAVLDVSFDVKREQTPNGPYLVVTGKDSTIGAELTHCATTAKCEGIEFFVVVDKKYTANQLNAFNSRYSYSKMLFDDEGATRLRLEIFTVGGVTTENINSNAAMLMVRRDDANRGDLISLNASPYVAQTSATPSVTPASALQMKATPPSGSAAIVDAKVTQALTAVFIRARMSRPDSER